MLNLLQTLRQNYKKAFLFAFYGGIGCLIIALILGEWFLDLESLIIEEAEFALSMITFSYPIFSADPI